MKAFLRAICRSARSTLPTFPGTQLGPRAINPYTTHLPILVGLGRFLRVEKVLELGCGTYSTLTFLDENIYSSLTKIDSVENNPDWAEKIQMITRDDSRFSLMFTPLKVAEYISKLDLTQYDLIFVDDSASIAERTITIGCLAARFPSKAIGVLHDYEIKEYQKAIRPVPKRYMLDALNPATGLVWSQANVNIQQLKRLNRTVKKYATEANLSDRQYWAQLFSQL